VFAKSVPRKIWPEDWPENKKFQKYIAEDWPESKKFKKNIAEDYPEKVAQKPNEFFKVDTTLCDMQQNGRMPFYEHDWPA
jgi:hypothetical protein